MSGPWPNGAAGAVVALVAIYLPTFLLVFGVVPFWDEVRGSARLRRALNGTNAAVVGRLAAALYTPVWTGAVTKPIDAIVVSVALSALHLGRASPLLVVGGCALAGQGLSPPPLPPAPPALRPPGRRRPRSGGGP